MSNLSDSKLLYLSAEEVDQSLSIKEAIEGMRQAFTLLSSGKIKSPTRTHLDLAKDNGTTLVMPVYNSEQHSAGVKIVTVSTDNPKNNLPLIHGLMILIDSTNGKPLAIIDAERLTTIRTGAASGLATDLLASQESETAFIFGAGEQGRTQLEAIATVRKLKKGFIKDINFEKAEQFANEMSEKLKLEIIPTQSNDNLPQADIICTATTSTKPLFEHNQLKASVHINAVGSYKPTMIEIPPQTVDESFIIVDSRSTALTEAGDIINCLKAGLLSEDYKPIEIGELLSNSSLYDKHKRECTPSLWKSVGNAAQDIVAAKLIYDNALKNNTGKQLL